MSTGGYINRGWAIAVGLIVVALAAALALQTFEYVRQAEALGQCVQQRQICAETVYMLSEAPGAAGRGPVQDQTIVVPHGGQR